MYVDCRAAFPNLDVVKDRLVLCASALVMKTKRIMRGRHTKRTMGFVKACLAYCHVTIPSIDDPFSRLHLFQLLGHVALANQCLPQCDTFFKEAIKLVQDLPEHLETGPAGSGAAGGRRASVGGGGGKRATRSEPRLVDFLLGFAGSLVVVPGQPGDAGGPFYLVKGLLNALERFPWEQGAGGKARVHIALLPLLCAYAQRALPYRVEGVDANDVLYGGNQRYVAELEQYFATLVEGILNQLTELAAEETGGPNGLVRQGTLVTELLNQLLACARVAATDADAGGEDADDRANEAAGARKVVHKLFMLARKRTAGAAPPKRGEDAKERRATTRFYENTVRHLLELSKTAARARSNGRAAQAPGYQALAVAIAPPPPGPPPARK